MAPKTQDEAKKEAGEAADKFIGGLSQPNFKKKSVVEAIKKAVMEEMAKDTATKQTIQDAIVKAVEDTVEAPKPPGNEKANEAFLAEQKKDRDALVVSAGVLADKALELKTTAGKDEAPKLFGEKMDKAAPSLPISNATLLVGGAAAAVTLFRPWDGFKNIAINLGIIAAGIGAGAYFSGDMTYLTSKKKDATRDAGVGGPG